MNLKRPTNNESVTVKQPAVIVKPKLNNLPRAFTAHNRTPMRFVHNR